MSQIVRYGRRRTAKMRAAQSRNLRKARKAKIEKALITGAVLSHMGRRKGGFLPALVASIPAIHETFKQIKPVSSIKSLGSALGYKLPDNKFGTAVKHIGNFLIDKLGYGRRKRKSHSRRRRHRR